MSPGRPLPYDVSPCLVELQRQAYSEEGRYQSIEDNQYLCAWPESGRRPRTAIFRAIRRSGLPQVERGGELEDLYIPTAAGLAEAIHVVFFDHNIVGADFNFYGPRMSGSVLIWRRRPAPTRWTSSHCFATTSSSRYAGSPTFDSFGCA